MKNLTKTKLSLLLTMILCVMMVSVVSAEKTNTSLKTLVEDTASSTKENKVDHLLDKYDEIQPRPIEPCPSCSVYLVSRKIGTGAWRSLEISSCKQHVNCAIKESVRDIHYEDYCGSGSCNYYNSYTNQEYKTDHLR